MYIYIYIRGTADAPFKHSATAPAESERAALPRGLLTVRARPNSRLPRVRATRRSGRLGGGSRGDECRLPPMREVGGIRLETSSRFVGSNKSYHGPQLTDMREKQRVKVSSNSRFQTVLFQQHSANLS